MKSRLEALSHTEEDRDCWWWSAQRVSFEVREAHMLVYCACDRRDADLMLDLAWDKVHFGRFVWPESLYDRYLQDGGDGVGAWPDPPHPFREVT